MTRSSLVVAAAVLLAASLRPVPVTSPSSWPMYQYRANHNAVFPGSSRAFSWHRKLGGKVNGGLAIVDGTVYVESFDKRLYALDMQTGNIRFSTPLENIAMTAPIVAHGLVVVGTGSNAPLRETPAQTIWGRSEGDYVEAISTRTGAVVWRQRTIGEDMPTPALVHRNVDDALVFVNGDNHVRALRLNDGNALWTLPARGIGTMSSAAAAGNMAYLTSGVPNPARAHDELYAIDVTAGTYKWRAPVGNADCSPTLDNGVVYVEGSGSDPRRPEWSSDFSDIVAVDAATGRTRWSWRSGFGRFTPVGSHEQAIAGLAVGGVLYQALPATSEFAAFDPAGHLRWKIQTNAPVKMSAVLYNGKLYFGDTGKTFYVVDAASGRIIGGREFPSYFTVSPPVIAGSTLYVVNNDTVLAIPLADL
jgi:outer membrane protein assembly factor BamB